MGRSADLQNRRYPPGWPIKKKKQVGGGEHECYFPFHIWDVILPIDELIFSRWLKPPSRNMIV